jgi:uncharacterized protein YndB with AHSA1/START domain
MTETIEVSTILPASPQQIYEAWIDSDQHSQFTGSPAEINPQVGGSYSAWDGYIKGVTLELTPYSRILQSWRADDFPPEAEDSQLEVRLEEVSDGTLLTLVHTKLPDGQGDEFKQGWMDFYFTPMQAFFSALKDS